MRPADYESVALPLSYVGAPSGNPRKTSELTGTAHEKPTAPADSETPSTGDHSVAPLDRNSVAKRSHEARFWSHVEKTLTCWRWVGSINRGGYGSCGNPGTRKTMLAHRRSWEMANGPIPAGLQLDHICKVRCCVRPDHLDLVTSWENTLRGNNQAAINAQKTHCFRGHEFNAENARTDRHGHRICRICARVSKNRRRAEDRWATQEMARIIAELEAMPCESVFCADHPLPELRPAPWEAAP